MEDSRAQKKKNRFGHVTLFQNEIYQRSVVTYHSLEVYTKGGGVRMFESCESYDSDHKWWKF